ncbi:MAG: phenylalanine--tRNA ligase subunit beta [Phycisphaerales bacterium]
MLISLAHLNTLIEPGNVTAEEAERLLTFIGFPIESTTPGADGDALLDVEVTSNRGDCLCHAGVAREVAAASGRRFLAPATTSVPPLGTVSEARASLAGLLVENRVPDACPLFTVRIIRGVKVGPSPAWLVARLAAVGQRSINNVVDVTNFVQSALGNPSHVFDWAKIRPGADGTKALIVRGAEKGEKLTLLDGKSVELRAGEIVVADGAGPSSLAGVMGGQDSGVTGTTTDVVLEVATWSPGRVRSAARRLQIRTDASHRFERFVDARTVDAASRRAAELIIQVAGGMLETAGSGVKAVGKPIPAAPTITFRPQRCRLVLGAGFTDDQIRTALGAQGVAIGNPGGESWACTPPDHRPDLKREIDFVEEVARTIGLEKIPLHERIAVRIAPPQSGEVATRELTRVLTGMGFFETVTVSFVSAKEAGLFCPKDWKTLRVSDSRRSDDGVLRPSAVASLLACRRANQHARAGAEGAVRLFELASIYGEAPEKTPARAPAGHVEQRTLTLIADAPAKGAGAGLDSAHSRRQAALRQVRAVVDGLVQAMMGKSARTEVRPEAPNCSGFDPDCSATIHVNGRPLGVMGLISAGALAHYELESPIAAAALDAPMLLEAYPPRELVTALPAFPATERDLSLVVDESLAWAEIDRCISSARPARMESLHFVGVYRGKPLDDGKKSVTLRMVFRDDTRTLRDDEVNSEVQRLIGETGKHLRAVVRV